MEKGSLSNKPGHLIISDSPGIIGFRGTLKNSSQLLEMLEYLDLSEELTTDAQFGVFLTLETVIDALRYVSHELDIIDKSEGIHAE